MLYNDIYNQIITPDIKVALYTNDAAFFLEEIHKMIGIIAARSGDVTDGSHLFDMELSRLHVCMAFYDSLTRHGETVKLLNDMVNF